MDARSCILLVAGPSSAEAGRLLQPRCALTIAAGPADAHRLLLRRRYDAVLACAADPRAADWILYQAAHQQPWALRIVVGARPPSVDAAVLPLPLQGSRLLALLFGGAA